MSKSEELIAYWCESLAQRIVEIRFIDLDEMRAALKTHLKSALFDCLRVQISETEKKLFEVKRKYTETFGTSNNHIQKEIISLKEQVKRNNMLYSELERHNESKEFNLWMKDNGHEDILNEFYAYYHKNFPNVKTIRESLKHLHTTNLSQNE